MGHHELLTPAPCWHSLMRSIFDMTIAKSIVAPIMLLYSILAAVAAVLFIYLLVALLKPEWFS